jgi:hypothetical protein
MRAHDASSEVEIELPDELPAGWTMHGTPAAFASLAKTVGDTTIEVIYSIGDTDTRQLDVWSYDTLRGGDDLPPGVVAEGWSDNLGDLLTYIDAQIFGEFR